MTNTFNTEDLTDVKRTVKAFNRKIESEMSYKSAYKGNVLSFDWLDEFEEACPRIDLIVRHAKVTLIQEQNVELIEKAKRITVESVKDLAKHTNYIDIYEPDKGKIIPSKILNVRSEETFNIYENKFLFTLINCMDNFVYKREQELKDLTVNDEKSLLYKGSSEIGSETVHIDLKITSVINNSKDVDKKIKEELNEIGSIEKKEINLKLIKFIIKKSAN